MPVTSRRVAAQREVMVVDAATAGLRMLMKARVAQTALQDLIDTPQLALLASDAQRDSWAAAVSQLEVLRAELAAAARQALPADPAAAVAAAFGDPGFDA